MHDVLLGLDLGSTSFKAVAASLEGKELAVASVPTPWKQDDLGTTLSPGEALKAAESVLFQCLDHIDNVRVVSLGVTGMAESGFLVDSTERVIAPAYAWFDERGSSEAEELTQDVTRNWFSSTTGLPLSVRCSIVKLRLSTRGDFSSRGLRWESLPEWLAHCFGGSRRAELSLAARTGLLNVHEHAWSSELLDWAGLEAAEMPPPQQAGQPWGVVSPGYRLAGAVLTVAGHDHVCAAIGSGAHGDFDIFNSLGTGEAVLCSSDPLGSTETLRAVKAGMTVGIHVVPKKHLLMVGLGTGARLSRVLHLLGISTTESLKQLESSLPRGSALSESAGWVAQIVRDGTALTSLPHAVNDPAATWQSAVMTAGSRLDVAIDQLERFSNKHDRTVTTGGWYRSKPFRQLRRLASRRPLEVPALSEATGLGAALMGGVAAEVYPSPTAVPEPNVEEL